MLVDRRQGEAVADRDRLRELGCSPTDLLDLSSARLAAIVQVDVDADVMGVGEPEHDVEVPIGVAVEAFGVEPADEVGTCRQGLGEQRQKVVAD